MKLKHIPLLIILALTVCSCESVYDRENRLLKEMAAENENALENPEYVGKTPDGRKITVVKYYPGIYSVAADRIYIVEGLSSSTTNTDHIKGRKEVTSSVEIPVKE